jgi:hypothetical protein
MNTISPYLKSANQVLESANIPMILWGENAMTLHGIPTGLLVRPIYIRISFCKADLFVTSAR